MSAGVSRKDGVALWSQVGETLAADIAAGDLAPGARLPTEPELMRRFGVSRSTVRQALGHLEGRGLVRAEQGRGTFVHRGVLEYALSKKTRFSRNLIEQGAEPGGELITQREIAATDLVAERLGLEAGALVIHRRGLCTADGVPVELADTYYPAARFPGFAEARLSHPTITGALKSYGVTDYDRRSTEIGARMPTAEEARLLRQPKSVPVITVTKLDVDQDGAPFCYAESLWASDRISFTIVGD